MEFQLSHLKSWKDDIVRVLHSIYQQIWKTQQWPQDLKRSVFLPIPKKGSAREGSNYCTIVLISHASKVRLKILQARLHHYVNWELLDVQAEFTKGRGAREEVANSHWITQKAREFQKNNHFCFTECSKSVDCQSQQTGKFLKRWQYQTTLSVSWEPVCGIKSSS